MRFLAVLLVVGGLGAEPLRWAGLPVAVQEILSRGGLTESVYPAWQARRAEALGERLAAGSAEHIAYFLLQSKSFTADAALDPAREARRYLDSLPLAQRRGFLAGEAGEIAFDAGVQRRVDAFYRARPSETRHRLLREMAERLGWRPERIVQTAFRFLMQRSAVDDADGLYQRRGLSADPFPESMLALTRGLRRTTGRPEAVLLAGPGAALGSRFGVSDALPVESPQPGALLQLLGKRPTRYECVDVRPEVVESLAGGPCRGSLVDLASGALPANAFDLAVATNVLVYLAEDELGVAMANLAQALRPGGCLLHNDSRFAARLFGEAAGIPVIHFETVRLGRRGEREQLDRVVVHCRAMAKPD